MKVLQGDLWDYWGVAILAITTCGQLSKQGKSFMLRGCARQAKERFPHLPARMGSLIQAQGNRVFDLGDGLVSFPVEQSAFEVPSLSRICDSCRQLVELADERGWPHIIVPRPGCGGGGLSWTEVRPILERHFDERFSVISAG